MENNTIESMKTPKRSRRLSSKELDETSHAKRSTRKTMILQEIEETDNVPTVDSVTPSRSAKLIDLKTPSRSDALATALTPRRSVRKSIKPIQEYENIIAQKGLCPKRAIISSLEDGEEEAAEGKWVPAVIGRVSTKRGKKARRAKKKQLQRQENIVEAESVDVGENVNPNQLNDENEEKLMQQRQEILEESSVGQNHLNKENVDDIKDKTNEISQVSVDEKLDGQLLEENRHVNENEKQPCNDNHDEDVKPLDRSTSNDEGHNNDEEKEVQLEQAIQEEKTLQSETPSTKVQKDELELEILDSSMESGDIEMETMPVTADDCMESPKTSPNKTANAHLQVDFTNKDDDSDCIMISFNDSSNTEQVDDESQKPAVVENLASDGDFCDSAENNMPTLLVCSDDEDQFEEVFVTKTDSEEKNNADPAIVEKETDGPLNRTFDAAESPIKNTESIEPETPKFRPSMTRVPTPYKSAQAIVPDVIAEAQEELDSDDTPELLMEPREIKLKSSRKRSFSFCVDRPKKCVTFHSPANTTVAIYDGDLMKTIQEDANNITERRKRSLSVTETEKEVVAYFKERKPTNEGTPSKRSKLPEPSSKSKMPNFAAIHQQQFKRMESISDHVARKAERAKVLSNSITKVKPTSVQKGLPVKNSVLRECNQSSSGHNKAMPKARQRIELSGADHKPKTEANNSLYSGLKYRSISKPDLAELHDFSLKLSSKMSSSSFVFTGNNKPRLPKPRFDATLNTLKAEIKVTSKTTTASVSHAQAIVPDSRPRFNTSTAIDRQPPKAGEKLDDRRKRYLDMYKSRSTARSGEKKSEILKGVRTNRRFELQMMCRNRPN